VQRCSFARTLKLPPASEEQPLVLVVIATFVVLVCAAGPDGIGIHVHVGI
jgi:hypothetical protein